VANPPAPMTSTLSIMVLDTEDNECPEVLGRWPQLAAQSVALTESEAASLARPRPQISASPLRSSSGPRPHRAYARRGAWFMNRTRHQDIGLVATSDPPTSTDPTAAPTAEPTPEPTVAPARGAWDATSPSPRTVIHAQEREVIQSRSRRRGGDPSGIVLGLPPNGGPARAHSESPEYPVTVRTSREGNRLDGNGRILLQIPTKCQPGYQLSSLSRRTAQIRQYRALDL